MMDFESCTTSKIKCKLTFFKIWHEHLFLYNLACMARLDDLLAKSVWFSTSPLSISTNVVVEFNLPGYCVLRIALILTNIGPDDCWTEYHLWIEQQLLLIQ